MSPALLGFLAGTALLIAAAWLFLWRVTDRSWSDRHQPIPEFRPRQKPQRAVTRLTKDNFTWEI